VACPGFAWLGFQVEPLVDHLQVPKITQCRLPELCLPASGDQCKVPGHFAPSATVLSSVIQSAENRQSPQAFHGLHGLHQVL
jgi:hypothetical protein